MWSIVVLIGECPYILCCFHGVVRSWLGLLKHHSWHTPPILGSKLGVCVRLRASLFWRSVHMLSSVALIGECPYILLCFLFYSTHSALCGHPRNSKKMAACRLAGFFRELEKQLLERNSLKYALGLESTVADINKSVHVYIYICICICICIHTLWFQVEFRLQKGRPEVPSKCVYMYTCITDSSLSTGW